VAALRVCVFANLWHGRHKLAHRLKAGFVFLVEYDHPRFDRRCVCGVKMSFMAAKGGIRQAHLKRISGTLKQIGDQPDEACA